jgi:hypothetical protein
MEVTWSCWLTFWHPSFIFNPNKLPTWCSNFSIYYPDVCLQFNMIRAFFFPSSGAQRLQWQRLALPSYLGDSRAVFVVGPDGQTTNSSTTITTILFHYSNVFLFTMYTHHLLLSQILVQQKRTADHGIGNERILLNLIRSLNSGNIYVMACSGYNQISLRGTSTALGSSCRTVFLRGEDRDLLPQQLLPHLR